MAEIILYPTETVYALGVNPLDKKAWLELCALKQRSDSQPASWLVRDIDDIRRYAEVGDVATRLIERCLPGPITLVLPEKDTVPDWARDKNGMKSFRISSDPKAQAVIAEYMKTHDTPLTCTSANVHRQSTHPTVAEILQQFGPSADAITQVIDGGRRREMASTVVSVENDHLQILRVGPVSIEQLAAALG